MHYHSYKAADLAADESFVAYFLEKDAAAVAFWQKWIDEHPEKLAEITIAKRMLTQLYLRLDDHELSVEVAKFDDFLQQSIATPELPVRKNNFNYFRIAAAAAVIALLSFFTITIYQQRTRPVTYITKHNTFGRKSIIILSDGSKVTLNSNSTLTFQKNFESDTRTVELSGEAFFEVAHDASKPFIVKTGKLVTKVLGTKFDVNAYPNLHTVKVALLQGSVAVNVANSNQQLTLVPNQMAVFSPNNSRLMKTTFDQNSIAWQQGTITFNNSSFDEIAAQFYNAYGITLINQSGEQQWNYTGSFQQANYLDIVSSICFAKGLHYQLTQKTITIIK